MDGHRQLYSAKISGTGSYLPEKRLTNADLAKLVDTNDEWITERTGIRSRRIAAEGELTTDLALKLSSRLWKWRALKPKDWDAIFFATVSPDQPMPSAAVSCKKKLGARDIMAFDLSAACSGFVYGLSLATEFIHTGRYKNILVVGAEILHNLVNYKDRETCILFGDGAGAAILSRTPEGQDSKIYSHHMHADGYISDLFVLPMGGSNIPVSHEALDQGLQWMKMKGRDIFKHAVRTMSQACSEALEANQMNGNDVDWVIPHQANIRIIEAVAKHFGIPMEKVVVEIAEMGNTSAATIPVSLDKAVRDGRIQRGQNVLLTAFGAGITSGSLLMRF